jgi:hypothetical protein
MRVRDLLLSAAFVAGVSFAASTPASAAFLGICDNAASEGGCPALNTSSPDPFINFGANDFEGSFQINGGIVQQGLGNPTSTNVNEGPGPNPNEIDFSGAWILGGAIHAQNETVFFLERDGTLSDVLHFAYSSDANGFGHLDGFVMSDVSGAIDPGFLSSRGIFATQTVSENHPFNFSNTNITAIFQSGVPEPATWAMMVLGIGGIGASLRTARRRQALAAV